MTHDKDRGGKWLLLNFGDTILRLAGVRGYTGWKAVQPETAAPRRIPDGLLEVQFPDQNRPDLFLVEIETYPEADAERQMFEDLLLIALERGVIAEGIVVVVLHPRGRTGIEGGKLLECRLGHSRIEVKWRVVELWKFRAEDLFASGDLGLIPWVPLTHMSDPPESILKECRQRIDEVATGRLHEALLVVTRIFTNLAFGDLRLNSIFEGGKQVFNFDEIIVPPLREEFERLYFEQQGSRRTLRENIGTILEERFGTVPDDLRGSVNVLKDEWLLRELHRLAVKCPDLDSFRSKLQEQSSKPSGLFGLPN